jgi:hypothetical protein
LHDPPYRRVREEHRRALQGGAPTRQGAALRAIPRCRAELEAGPRQFALTSALRVEC